MDRVAESAGMKEEGPEYCTLFPTGFLTRQHGQNENATDAANETLFPRFFPKGFTRFYRGSRRIIRSTLKKERPECCTPFSHKAFFDEAVGSKENSTP
jgi:hypothetical protein